MNLEPLPAGHYARKQIFCKDWLIAWTHRSRFATGVRLAQRFRGQRVLDYGCGDGTFLAMLCSGADRPAEAVGVELDAFQIDDCRARLGQFQGLSFEPIASLDTAAQSGRFDAVICMEVLEHVVDLETVITRLWWVLAPGGTLIVSVPVETGLPLLIKQAARRVAGWRGLGDYAHTTGYTPRRVLGRPDRGQNSAHAASSVRRRDSVSRSQGLQLDEPAREVAPAVHARGDARVSCRVARPASGEPGVVRDAQGKRDGKPPIISGIVFGSFQ